MIQQAIFLGQISFESFWLNLEEQILLLTLFDYFKAAYRSTPKDFQILRGNLTFIYFDFLGKSWFL